MVDAAAVLVVAIVVELVIGDPESGWHPVALFGRVISAIMSVAPSSGPQAQLAFGVAAVAVSVGAVAIGSALILGALHAAAPAAAVVVGAVLLKSSGSYRQLESAARAVAKEIEQGELVGARSALCALVSRDTSTLSGELAASAAIESLAENLCDSVVAPLCFFVVGGVPGALAYRAINTWDAMVGYHGRYEYLGKAAARLDDAANYIPARITAGLLVVAAALARADAGGAMSQLRGERMKTESPNAGWPMATMAGALGVGLEKPGHYRLGAELRAPGPTDVDRAAGIARWTALLAGALALCGTLLGALL